MALVLIFSPAVLAQLMGKRAALGELAAAPCVLNSLIGRGVTLAGDIGAEGGKHVVQWNLPELG
jgi:hypothetical protein